MDIEIRQSIGWGRAALMLGCLLVLTAARGASGQDKPATSPDPPKADVTAPAEQPDTPGSATEPSKRKAPPIRTPEPDQDERQPAAKASPPVPAPAPRPSTMAYSSPILRLASVPNMLGDSLQTPAELQVNGNTTLLADLPLASTGYRVKIADNNKALPQDRCYFMYRHFHNALETNLNVGTAGRCNDANVDQFVLGWEKTFRDSLWSVDLRLPLANDYQYAASGLGIEGGDVGNFSVTLKRLLVASRTCSVAAGLGIGTPTGDDLTVTSGNDTLTLRNDTVFLSPYVGFLSLPNDRLFCHGFLQVDVPTCGNRVQIARSPSDARWNDQTLMYVDVSAGYWIYRDPCASRITGVAPLVEFHYTTTLQDADLVTGTFDGAPFQLGNLLNRIDVVNVTVGLHAEVAGRTTVRVAGVFPLEKDPERPFDAEVQVSVNRRF